MGLTGVFLTPPVGLSYLSELTVDIIKSLTIEATLNFLKSSSYQTLQKIILVDQDNEDSNPSPYQEGWSNRGPGRGSGMGSSFNYNYQEDDRRERSTDLKSETALYPASNDRMALILILLLEQELSAVKELERERDIAVDAIKNDPFKMLDGELEASVK
jgi:hypothetical protein